MTVAIESEILRRAGFRHGFFTRRGGHSPPPWASLNFSTGTGDGPERVERNLAVAAARLGVAPERVYFLSQVHGTDHRVLVGTDDAVSVRAERGDITVSRVVGVACGVRMADCATVLLGDPATGAVAAIHAGWRGVVQGAVGTGVRALESLVGMRGGAGRLLAAVGPHIERCCFEVGADVAAELARASVLGERAVVRRTGTKPHVDLRAIVEAQLRDAGVAEIDQVLGCTVCDAESFHSYRRDGPVSGRMLAAIVVRRGAP